MLSQNIIGQISQLASLTNIKSLELHLNPWRCDCHLKQFRFEQLLSLSCCFVLTITIIAISIIIILGSNQIWGDIGAFEK